NWRRPVPVELTNGGLFSIWEEVSLPYARGQPGHTPLHFPHRKREKSSTSQMLSSKWTSLDSSSIGNQKTGYTGTVWSVYPRLNRTALSTRRDRFWSYVR